MVYYDFDETLVGVPPGQQPIRAVDAAVAVTHVDTGAVLAVRQGGADVSGVLTADGRVTFQATEPVARITALGESRTVMSSQAKIAVFPAGDTSVAGLVGDTASQTSAALSGIYALRVEASRPGSRAVTLGDSITQADDQASTLTQGSSWPHYASILSGQRVTVVKNAGIAGNNTAQMLARFDTDVAPSGPNMVILLAGTNDVGQDRTFEAWTADVEAIVGKCRGIGAVPVLGTIPPNDLTGRHQRITQWNAWLRTYAATEGLTVVPFHQVLTDPVNGNYKATLTTDGTHPTTAGQAAMGKAAADTLAEIAPITHPPLVVNDADQSSSISNGCFTTGTGSAYPPGWIDNAGTTGSTLSYVTDAAVPGQMLRMTQAAAVIRQAAYNQYIGVTTLSSATLAGATSLTIPIRADFGGVLFIGVGATFEVAKIASSAGAGPQTETLVSPLRFAHAAGEQVVANAAPGDELIFTGRVTSDGGVVVTADTACAGGAFSPSAMKAMVGAITRGVWHQRFPVPAGTTQIAWRLTAGSGTGTVDWGQVGVFNATRLGLA